MSLGTDEKCRLEAEALVQQARGCEEGCSEAGPWVLCACYVLMKPLTLPQRRWKLRFERTSIAGGGVPAFCFRARVLGVQHSHLVFLPAPQGDLQKVQEHLCLPDRSSLLAEIQALRAQLRMTHLQNQEKLQQLCAALTSTEARGSQREHQLRRQGGCPCSVPAGGLPDPCPAGPSDVEESPERVQVSGTLGDLSVELGSCRM